MRLTRNTQDRQPPAAAPDVEADLRAQLAAAADREAELLTLVAEACTQRDSAVGARDWGRERLTEALSRIERQDLTIKGLGQKPDATLTDHGSPCPHATRVRQLEATLHAMQAVQDRLQAANAAHDVVPSAMFTHGTHVGAEG